MNKNFVIVNNKDYIIGYKSLNEITTGDIYRVSALWITNNKGYILLARRALSKKKDPGKWGPAVAGTVEKEETYYSNIIKEAKEELGLRNIKPKKLKKLRVSGKYNYFLQWYTAKINENFNNFRINKKEVDRIKWFSRKELKERLKSDPSTFIDSVKQWIRLFI